MKVNITKEDRNKVVEFRCKKIYGTIEVRYVDDETGEIIKTEVLDRTSLGEILVLPTEIEGYEIIEESQDETVREITPPSKSKTVGKKPSLEEMKAFRDSVKTINIID